MRKKRKSYRPFYRLLKTIGMCLPTPNSSWWDLKSQSLKTLPILLTLCLHRLKPLFLGRKKLHTQPSFTKARNHTQSDHSKDINLSTRLLSPQVLRLSEGLKTACLKLALKMFHLEESATWNLLKTLSLWAEKCKQVATPEASFMRSHILHQSP